MPAKRQDIQVTLHGDAGEALELVLSPSSTGHTLKKLVADSWNVPPICQRLARGKEFLEDADRLTDHCTFESKLELSLVEAYEELDACLAHENASLRLAAVRCLLQLARRDHDRAVAAVRTRLEDADLEVRRAAAEVLAALAHARPGDNAVTGMLLELLADGLAAVRAVAMEALAQGARRSDPATLKAVQALLQDWRGEVRRTAVKSLSLQAKRGDEASVRALCASLADADAEVRAAALRALPLVAPRGDACAARELRKHLGHASADVRRQALQALALVSREGGDPPAAASAAACLFDAEAEVRLAAVEALVLTAPRGQLEALNGLGGLLGLPPLPVPVPKKAAAAEDSEDSEEEKGPTEVIPEVPEEEAEWAVRRATLQGLAKLAKPGDERVVCGVAACLEDEAREVRQAALEALTALVPRGSKLALREVAEHLDHESADVRLVAVRALARLAPQDDPRVMAALADCTREGEAMEVRRAALEALACLAKSGSVCASQVAVECLGDRSADMRRTALGVLPRVLPGPDAQSGGSRRPGGRGSKSAAGGAQQANVAEFVAGPEVHKLGLAFSSVPPGPLRVASVSLASWAQEAGLEAGDEVEELNGASLDGMDTPDFWEALEQRPLRLVLRPRPSRPEPGPEPEPGQVREAAVAAIAERLKDRDGRTRAAAAEALALCGGEGPAAWPRALLERPWAGPGGQAAAEVWNIHGS